MKALPSNLRLRRAPALAFGFLLAATTALRADPPVPAAAPAPPAEAAQAADMPGPCDDWLANPKLPLDPERRSALVRDLVARGRWGAMNRLLTQALLTDTKSGFVDQTPWISRLRLAQACAWLGTPEKAFLEAELARLAQQRGLFAGKKIDEVAAAFLASPEGAKKLAPILGDEENFPRPDFLAHRIAPETLAALLENQPLIDLLGETVTAADYQPGVWRVLADLQEHRPGGVARYPALAVALAVVYDQAFPSDWPHAQVARARIPFVWQNWNVLFDYFIEAQENGQLLVPLDSLTPAQLRFVVDIPLERSELDWLQANVRATRPAFEKVFFTVRYDQKRLWDGVYTWPGQDYRLASLVKEGGICVDQAYFAVMAGKAKGLPTLYFTGRGSYGGHAWFGYLREDGWFLDGGRYANQNYVAGNTRDPQDWQPITDHRLAFLDAPVDSVTLYSYARNLLALALMPGVRWDLTERQRLLDAALEVDPKLPEIWEAVADALRELGQDDLLRAHYRRMAAQFAGQDDLRVEALHALARLEDEAGHADVAQAARDAILASRSDLAIQEAGEIVVAHVRATDYDGAEALYQEFLARFAPLAKGKKASASAGDLFAYLVLPYALALDTAREGSRALYAVKSAEPSLGLNGDAGDAENPLGASVRGLKHELAERAKRRQTSPSPGNPKPA